MNIFTYVSRKKKNDKTIWKQRKMEQTDKETVNKVCFYIYSIPLILVIIE